MCSVGPGTYSVASHSASGSASTTAAVQKPPTARIAATSWRKRSRNPESSASSGRMTFTATGLPPGERARNTRPMAPCPSRPSTA